MKSKFKMENMGDTYNRDIGNDQLEEASKLYQTNDNVKLVGQLAAVVAHEIRNPLTSIKGFVQLLDTGVSNPKYYSMIYSEINRIEEIVDRLVGFAETQSVNFHINDIGFILERTILRMTDLALLKDIKINLSLEEVLLSIYCDETELQQAFENIIENAIEASASNTEVDIICKKIKSHVHIMIKDEGVGIAEERMVHLFEPYYCIKESGTGFGLMISRKILQEHNGTIQVKSEVGIGTTVEVYLPLLNS